MLWRTVVHNWLAVCLLLFSTMAVAPPTRRMEVDKEEMPFVELPWHRRDAKTFTHDKGKVMSSFKCTDHEYDRARNADKLANRGIIVNDWCFLGINKFGWACFLTAVSMIGLILCIPLVLALSRRRPPGSSLLSVCIGGSQPYQFQRPPPPLLVSPPHSSTVPPATYAMLSQLPDSAPKQARPGESSMPKMSSEGNWERFP